MRQFYLLTLICGLGLSAGAADADADADGEVAVGQKAPDFTLRGVDGATYALSDHVGKRGFVLAWFPKAFTPG